MTLSFKAFEIDGNKRLTFTLPVSWLNNQTPTQSEGSCKDEESLYSVTMWHSILGSTLASLKIEDHPSHTETFSLNILSPAYMR